MVREKNIIKFVLPILASIFFAVPVFASTTDGTISSGDAWSAKIGWINFATTNGNVHVTDSALTGYVWSSFYGWIKLNPANSGVTNNGEGVLSGSAWGENIGWIDFSGVTIGSNGIFSGTANGDNTGVINFSCTNCLVQTDWRPASTRSSGQSGSGGTAIPVTVSPPPPGPDGSVTTSTPTSPSTTTPVSTTTVSPTSTSPPPTSPIPPPPSSPPSLPDSPTPPTSIGGQIVDKLKNVIGQILGKPSSTPDKEQITTNTNGGSRSDLGSKIKHWWSNVFYQKVSALIIAILLLLYFLYKKIKS